MQDPGHAIGYKVLAKGTPVVTSDGVEIGTVAKVLDNAREHIFDGIVVNTSSGDRFVDAPEVRRITTDEVELSVALSDVLRRRGARAARRAGARGDSAA